MKPLIGMASGMLMAAVPLTLVWSNAYADAKLVTAAPAPNASVGVPQMIQLQFNERLNPNLSDVNLMTGTDAPIPVQTKTDGMMIEATPKVALGPGTYRVLWRAVGANGGDRSHDAYQFVIR